MGKKMLIIIGVVVVLVAALIFVVQAQNQGAVNSDENPYDTDDLKQETIDQIGDPLYQNQIMPDELDQAIENGESVTVYYFSPTCAFCQQTTPYLVPLAEEMGVDLQLLNLHEFGETGTNYGIQATPTVVHYENGEEVGRLAGQYPEEGYRAFFEQYVTSGSQE